MASVRSVLRLVLRASIWRTTPAPQFVGLPSLLLWTIVIAALRVALQFTSAGVEPHFNPYGLNAVVAWLALELAIAALFVPAAARTTALSAMLALTIIAEIAIDAIKFAVARVPQIAATDALWRDRIVSIAVFVAVSLWWIGAMAALLRSFAPWPRFGAFGRVAALWLALIAASALIPHAPAFVGHDFDIRAANLWEALHAQLTAPAPEAGAQAEAAGLDPSQRSLLQAQVTNLSPPTKGATDVYALGIAGWADQDVFLKELDGGLAAIGGILPIHGRTLRLINHSETQAKVPLANPRNFAAAVHAIAAVMDKTEDVLLLLMTSHGEPTGFGLRLPSELIAELTPQEVAATLNNEGIKNRVVIVSACYAGTFVPPLANDDTIVIAAADAKNTSFGCAPERDWTYFGDAFFRQSVRPGRDFQHAFDNARVLIEGWELMDRAHPSNPQAHFGPALVARLAPFFAPGAPAPQ